MRLRFASRRPRSFSTELLRCRACVQSRIHVPGHRPVAVLVAAGASLVVLVAVAEPATGATSDPISVTAASLPQTVAATTAPAAVNALDAAAQSAPAAPPQPPAEPVEAPA